MTADGVLRAMVEMFATGEVGAAHEVIAPDYVDHQGLRGESPLRGVEGFVRVVGVARAAGLTEVTIEDVFGTADRACARLRWAGDRETIEVVRVDEGGRAVEHWGARV